MEGWRVGGMKGWRDEGCKIGEMKGWVMIGRMEDWKDEGMGGGMKGWRDGGMNPTRKSFNNPSVALTGAI